MTDVMRAMGGLVAIVVLCGASVVYAAPEYVRLSYDSAATDSEMAVTWNTARDVGTTVQYGTAPGNLTSSVSGNSYLSVAQLGYVHEVTLTGLSPSTTYYYRAGDAADGFSEELHFATAPEQDENCGSFRFVFLGDNRPDEIFGGGENYEQILGESLAHEPAFALAGGDLVEDGETPSQWRTFLEYSSQAFHNIPLMPCLGNHDTGPMPGDNAFYNDVFALPRAMGEGGSGTEDYYYFTYGNAIIVSLSTETYNAGELTFGEQAAWFDRVLTENPRRWKIVMLHKPIYTVSVLFGLGKPSNEAGQNEAFVDIIDKHKVDVVIGSHNHWYERFEPSACGAQGNPGSEEPCPVGVDNFAEGAVHIVSGGAGAFTVPGFLCGDSAGRTACSGNHHYLLFDVDDNSLTMEAWGATPEPNEIIDVFTITKPASECSPVTTADAGPIGPADGGPGDPADAAAPSPDASSLSFDGGSSDAGVGPGIDSEPAGGCCRVAGGGAPPRGALLLVVMVGLLLRRRQRR